MSYTVTEFKDANKPEIKKLINEVYSSNPESYGYIKYGEESKDPLLLTKLLYSNGKIIGFLTLWKNNVHPESLYLHITIKFSSNYEKEFDILYKKAVEQKKKLKLRFQTLYPHMDRCVSLLKKRGFKGVMRTFDFSIPIKFLNLNLNTSQKYELISVDKVSFVDKKKICKKVKEYYHLTHNHNPPKNLDDNFWFNVTFGENNYREYSYLILESNEKVCFISFDKGLEPNNIYLAKIIWYKSIDFKKKQEIFHLVFDPISKDKRFINLELEVDDKSPNMMEFLELMDINYDKNNYFLTLQKD